MTILVAGASGATGKLLVEQLLNRGERVKIIVRSTQNLPGEVLDHENLSVIHGSILALSDAELIHHVSDCDALVSCLGHNLTFKGVFGNPRRLVTESARRLCNAVKTLKPEIPVKFILMNSTGCMNPDNNENVSLAQMCVLWLLRTLLPPHTDNEQAVAFLRSKIGQSDRAITWAAVRPDGLIDENDVTDYSLHSAPTRSAIFNAGSTSRINVAHFMSELIINQETWEQWKGKTPVIYNV